ncbi:MAG TPA: LytR C-terminal domain-containing protein, partial [Candidatus Obscuribacterales bacterium]
DPQAVPSLVKKLRLAGYHNVSIGDRLPEPLGVTQIVAQQGDADSAQAVYQSLGFGDVRVDTSGVLYSDVTIKLGQDWLQKNETVDSSLKP